MPLKEHTITPIEGWQDPALPMTGVRRTDGSIYYAPVLSRYAREDITDAVFHHPGADWKDLGWQDFNLDGVVDVRDTITLIRQAHRSYIHGTRRYSLGYCYYIGVLGDIYEVRGLRFANAANKGHADKGKRSWNGYSVSIHLVTNNIGGVWVPANELQVAAANWLLDHLERELGHAFSWVGVHGDGDFTSCAGTGNDRLVHTGVIAPGKSIITNPPNPEVPMPNSPQPGDAKICVIAPINRLARFVGIGVFSPTGKWIVPEVYWARHQATVDAQLGEGAELLVLQIGDLKTVRLDGPVPVGDGHWSKTEHFANPDES